MARVPIRLISQSKAIDIDTNTLNQIAFKNYVARFGFVHDVESVI